MTVEITVLTVPLIIVVPMLLLCYCLTSLPTDLCCVVVDLSVTFVDLITVSWLVQALKYFVVLLICG